MGRSGGASGDGAAVAKAEDIAVGAVAVARRWLRRSAAAALINFGVGLFDDAGPALFFLTEKGTKLGRGGGDRLD